MKPAPLGTRHGRSWRPLFLFRLALYPSAREKKERAVGPFHSPGDPGRSLGPDRSEENGITFPAVFPGRSGLLTFRLSLMQVTLWKSTWGYQMVAVALGSASGNTGQLETGMLVYVQYGVIGGQHGVSFFLFFFILFPIFFFNLWLAIYDRPYDRSFFCLFT
jgi:hypothetical protein